jgi:hypothetical protein
MEATVRHPLTNVQLELLKTFSHQLSDKDILELKKNLALFFAKKLIFQADKTWSKKGFDDTTIDQLLVTKLRKSK